MWDFGQACKRSSDLVESLKQLTGGLYLFRVNSTTFESKNKVLTSKGVSTESLSTARHDKKGIKITVRPMFIIKLNKESKI